MYTSVYSYLRYIVAFEIEPRESPKVFEILKNFLETTSAEDFSTTELKDTPKEIKIIEKTPHKIKTPMTLTESATKKLENTLKGYYTIFKHGLMKDEKEINFLYLIGQYLIRLSVNFEILSEEDKEFINHRDKLFKIWGISKGEKPAHFSLIENYKGKNNPEIISDLKKRIDDSIKLLEDIFSSPKS